MYHFDVTSRYVIPFHQLKETALYSDIKLTPLTTNVLQKTRWRRAIRAAKFPD
jgi:hypothetical protein